AEARLEEVGLRLPVELEGDVVVEGRVVEPVPALLPRRGPRRPPSRRPGPAGAAPDGRPVRLSLHGRAAVGRPARHQVRMASRTMQAAVIAVRPDGSHRGDTSTRSKPTTRAVPRRRRAVRRSGTVTPPGSGAPVPGAIDGSRTSMSMVT